MILIVDSEKVPESKIKQSFVELGFKSIVVAKNAEQARYVLEQNNKSAGNDAISLIIISNELDDADEFEFCREIKKKQCCESVYIILLVSSDNNKSAIEKARQSGASDYSVKPYHSQAFQKHFQRYVKNKVVVLIEDDVVTRQVVCSVLVKYEVEVLELEDGLQAHNSINSMLPARMVLMDIGLPNMNGIQLVEQIRNKKSWKKTPVIMLTASSDVSDVKKSLSAGANDYITKPFNISDVVQRLAQYLHDENEK